MIGKRKGGRLLRRKRIARYITIIAIPDPLILQKTMNPRTKSLIRIIKMKCNPLILID